VEKKFVAMMLAGITAIFLTACGGSENYAQSGQPEQNSQPEQGSQLGQPKPTQESSGGVQPSETDPGGLETEKPKGDHLEKGAVYKVGDTWTVDGQWSLTVNSVQEVNKRNKKAGFNPAAVYMVDYTYENLGFEDATGTAEGLSVDVFSNGSVVDNSKASAQPYPGDITRYPQQIPIHASCNAQACIGVKHAGSFTILFEMYDSGGNPQKATFKINLSKKSSKKDKKPKNTYIPKIADDNENGSEKSFAEKYDNEIIASSKSFLERSASGYEIPSDPKLWSVADFDGDGAVMAVTDLVEKATGNSEEAIVVLTPELDGGKFVSATPHYVSVGNIIFEKDGYCDDFFSNLEDISG